MVTSERMSISNPGVGLLIYDLEQNGFYCYAGTEWIKIQSGLTSIIADTDGDTKIQVEESPDDDQIRFDVAGSERWVMTGNRLESRNPYASIYIGDEAGGNAPSNRYHNIAIGDSTLLWNEENFNIAIGRESLKENLSGRNNIGIGVYSLLNNLSGENNVGIGSNALGLNSSGYGNIGLGINALFRNINGHGNIAIGREAMSSSNQFGDYNIAIGAWALDDNSSGNKNIAIGFKALNNSRNKDHQVAIGDSSLILNGDANSGTSEFHNTAIGSATLAMSVSGRFNTAIGFHAGRTALGSGNIYLGYRAGEYASGYNKLYIENSASNNPLIYGEFDNRLVQIDGTLKMDHFEFNGPRLEIKNSGSSVFIGEKAGENDDLSTNRNVFIGNEAGKATVNGDWNIAIGNSALLNNQSGNRNVAIGHIALRDGVGAKNVAVGIDAGQQNTGNNNVFIGFEAGRTNPGSSNVFIGNQAGANFWGSNLLCIDNSSTGTPLIFGDFLSNELIFNGSLDVKSGTDAAPGGGGYLMIGTEEGHNVVVDNNEIMGRNNGVISSLSFQADGGDLIVHNNYPEIQEFIIKDNGRVGIGETNPAYKLDVRDTQASNYVAQILNNSTDDNGHGLRIKLNSEAYLPTNFIGFYDEDNIVEGRITGVAGSAVAYLTTSDRRLKTNIQPLNNALSIISRIKPSTYQWKSDGTDDFGFIAQELQKVLPTVAVGDPNGDPSVAPMGIDYGRLTPVLVAAIQELQEKVEQLEKQLSNEQKKDIHLRK